MNKPVIIPDKKPSWPPPQSWKLQALSADGSVIAEVSRRPHHAPVVTGNLDCLAGIIGEVKSACRFFDTPPFTHGHN